MVDLGESLNKLLTGLEDLGMDAAIPTDMEMDLRHAMNLVDISDATAALTVASQWQNNHNAHPSSWPDEKGQSPIVNRKFISMTSKKDIDYLDAGNEADDDLTDDFLSTASPFDVLSPEDRQMAQFLHRGLLKSGSGRSNQFMPGKDDCGDDGDDTDADVDDVVIDEEEMNNFVDFLQFATGTDFPDCADGSQNVTPTDFLEFAAFAYAAVSNKTTGASKITEHFTTTSTTEPTTMMKDIFRKDTNAFDMLPLQLTLQDPITRSVEQNDDGVSNAERLFLSTSSFNCKKFKRKMSKGATDDSLFATSTLHQ